MKNPVDLSKAKWQWATLLLLSLISGSSFKLMDRGLDAFSPNQVAAMRNTFSFIVLIPVIWYYRKKIKPGHIKWLFLCGLLGNGIPSFLFTNAQSHINSSLAAILNGLTPVFTLLIGLFIVSTKVRLGNVIGIILGFFGAAFLALNRNKSGIEINIYALLPIIATILYAFNIHLIRNKLADLPPLLIIAMALLFIGPFTGVYLFTTNFTEVVATHPDAYASLGYIVILSVMGTSIAYALGNVLIKHVSPLFAASNNYIVPVVALMWGFLDNESILPSYFIGIAAILCGVYLVNKR